ncbi:MAG: hypothetical protein WBF48_13775 [Halarcobacter sp.]
MVIRFIDCVEKYHNEMNEIIDFLSAYFTSLGIENHRTKISEMQIARCTQCRCCTQKKGDIPAKCVIKDELNDELDDIEKADAFVILADRNNLFSRNKVHAKFSERMVAYYYWPYGQVQSTHRKTSVNKASILINYNTTKYFMNHSFYTTKTFMKHTSTAIGAKDVDWQAITPQEDLLEKYKKRLIEMADNLIYANRALKKTRTKSY